MNKQEALNLARQSFLQRGIDVGTPSSVTYHPEGGKSLENVQRIQNYQSILNVPYWEVAFYNVGPNQIFSGDQVIVVVFENGRMLLVDPSRPGISLKPNC